MTIRTISHRYLSQAAYAVEPWKNRLGSTDIIAEERVENAPEEGWDGLVWRLARTDIPTASPFSDHTGFERHQVVIEGEGLYLDATSGTIDLSVPLKPVRYGGELKIVSRLEKGGVKVLNLMVDRSLATGEMTVISAGEARELAAGTHVLSAVTNGARVMVQGMEIDISGGDAFLLEIASTTSVAVKAGPVIISSIFKF